MNKQEINEWIKTAELVDIIDSDHDECGNHWLTSIYKKDGKFFSLDFCNHVPSEKWENDKVIRGVYEPEEVTRHTRIVEEAYYTKTNNNKG